MSQLTYDNLVARLLAAVPEFPADPGDVQDNLVYLVFNDLTRFVRTLVEGDSNDQLLRRIFEFMETAASTKDPQITDVLMDSFNDLAVNETAKISSYMGNHTRRVYQEVCDKIYGSPSMARKFGRFIRTLFARS